MKQFHTACTYFYLKHDLEHEVDMLVCCIECISSLLSIHQLYPSGLLYRGVNHVISFKCTFK